MEKKLSYALISARLIYVSRFFLRYMTEVAMERNTNSASERKNCGTLFVSSPLNPREIRKKE